jgi:hypothetical protein
MRGRAQPSTFSREFVRIRLRGPSTVSFADTFSREGRRDARVDPRRLPLKHLPLQQPGYGDGSQVFQEGADDLDADGQAADGLAEGRDGGG